MTERLNTGKIIIVLIIIAVILHIVVPPYQPSYLAEVAIEVSDE